MDAGKSGYRTKASARREGAHAGHQDSGDDGFAGGGEDDEEGENCGETKGGVAACVNNGCRCDAVVETGLLSSSPLSLSSSSSSSSSSTSSSAADLGGPCSLTAKQRNDKKKYYEFSQCRLLKTISLCSCFAGIGFSNALLGTTVVHMEHLLETNTQTMAFTFTCQAIGYTVGGLLCGLFFDRVNPELGFTISIIIQAAATIATGYAGHVSTFMVWIGVVGLASGYVETAGQSYGVSLWTRHRFKEPFLQGLHTIWSLAAMIEPLLIHSFLGEFSTNSTLAPLGDNHTYETGMEEVIRCTNYSSSNCTENVTTMDDMRNWTDPGAVEWQEAIIQQARYAYLMVGFLIFPSSVSFTAVYLYSCSPPLQPRRSKSLSTDETMDECKTTSSQSDIDQRRLLRYVFLFLLFIVCLLNACCENIPEAYLTMFVIKHLGWPVQRGTLIMSIFYGTQSAGSLVGVGLSTVIRPRTMISFNLCISIVAYLLLLCAPQNDAVVLVSVALAGYGTSSTFAAIVLWVSESVQVSGGVSATLMIGGAAGDMTGPLIIGQLFESYSPLWLIYAQIMITSSLLLLFVLLLVFIHRKKEFINLDLQLTKN